MCNLNTWGVIFTLASQTVTLNWTRIGLQFVDVLSAIVAITNGSDWAILWNYVLGIICGNNTVRYALKRIRSQTNTGNKSRALPALGSLPWIPMAIRIQDSPDRNLDRRQISVSLYIFIFRYWLQPTRNPSSKMLTKISDFDCYWHTNQVCNWLCAENIVGVDTVSKARRFRKWNVNITAWRNTVPNNLIQFN